MSWVAVAVAAASATVGAYRYFHAKRQAKKNVRPEYEIDPIYGENLSLLENSMGLPQSALELLYNRNGQATSQGINAVLSSGGNANQIAGLISNQYTANENIGLQDAFQRKQDINGIINARLMLAEQNDKDFQLNQFNPYKDKAQALAAEQAGAYAQFGNAVNSASSSIANYKTGQLAKQYGNQGGFDSAKMAALSNQSGASTPNSGVNINAIYQDLYGNNQSPFVNQNNMTIGNIGQAPQYNFNNQIPFNMNNQYPYFNPSMVSLYNNPYSF